MAKKVLIVDDETDIVNFMERFLKRFKIAGVKASTGEQALTIFREDKIDFVFLDINMKGMDGLTVLTELRKLDPNAKVFMITGNQEQATREKAMSLGALDFITKPLDLNELKEKIEKYIL